MAKGAFIVAPDPGNPKDILFKVASEDVKEIPEDQLILRDEVDRALTVIRTAFRDDEKRFSHYYRQLLSLAQTGLVGNAAQPGFARRALIVLKNDIVASEGSAIKNRYMKTLGFRALTLAMPGMSRVSRQGTSGDSASGSQTPISTSRSYTFRRERLRESSSWTAKRP
jgi:hypothetical protein